MTALQLLSDVLVQTFWVLYEGGLFVLAGFAVAGLLHAFVDPARIVRRLGERSLRSAAIAALLGAPLPLCSCGVLPAALALRKRGASRESTLSFLITTPETGVDSVAVTWAFFGPVMAVIRPVVAVITGVVAAALSLRRPPDAGEATDASAIAADLVVCHEGHLHADALEDVPAPGTPAGERLRRAGRYAFVELFDDLGFWLVFAFLLTGLLQTFLPDDFFARALPGSLLEMLVMVAIGVPLYVCASASTPLAAVFVAKGASIGAALVFLLVGPATNAATIGAISRVLGRSFLRIYLGSIIGVALAAGLLVDTLFPSLAASVSLGAGGDGAALSLAKTIGAVVLGALLVASLRRTGLRGGLRELRDNALEAGRWLVALRPGPILRHRATHVLLGLWLLSVLAGSVVSVPPGNVALRQRFGRLVGEPLPPGIAFAWPGIERVQLIHADAVREQTVGYRRTESGLTRTPVHDEATYLTGDENVIELRSEAQYRITDPAAWQLAAERPDEILRGVLRAGLVEAMAGRPIDRVYTDERAEVEAFVLARARSDASEIGLGIELLAVRLLDVHAPQAVHDAFRDIASAHEDRQTTVHKAHEYAAGSLALARGEAERTVAAADAEAASRVAGARGQAVAFASLAEEHHRAPGALEARLYLEALERALPGVRKIVRPDAGALGAELWLRGGEVVLPDPSGGRPPAPSSPSSSSQSPSARPSRGTAEGSP